MNIVEFLEMYLPEIMVVLGVLAPTLPAIITKVVSDVRTKRLLQTFKEQQTKLTNTSSSYQVDVARLEMNLKRIEESVTTIDQMAVEIDAIRAALGIRKPIPPKE